MKMDDRLRPLVFSPDAAASDPSAATGSAVTFAPEPTAGERRAVGRRAPASSPLVAMLGLASLVWIATIAAMVVRGHGVGAWRGPEVALGLALALVPASFIVLFAVSLGRLLRLAADVRGVRSLSDDLVGPAALAASQVGGVVEALRSEIDRAAGAAADAVGRLQTLRSALADEGGRIVQAGADAARESQGLVERLQHERVEMERLAAELVRQADGVELALSERSKVFALASETAAIQIRAAGDGLEGGIERLTIAAEAADRAAESASGKLTAQAERLGDVGGALGATLAQFGAGVAQERESLIALVETLRLEHEDAAAISETRTARLRAEVVDARSAAEAVAAAADHAVEAVRGAVAEAAEKLNAVVELGRAERQRLAGESDAELDRLSDAAADRREALLTAARDALDSLNAVAAAASIAAEGRLVALREDAGTVADAARARVDEMGEAAFEAGRRADQAFETRIGAAQRTVEAVAAAMDEASRRVAVRIETGLAGPRDALHDLDGLLRQFDARLPEEARARAGEIRRAIDEGVEALTAAARRTADETLAVDAAFQERVRSNYASLSEAVRLMSAAVENSDSLERVKAAARPGPAPPERVAAPAPPAPAASSRPILLNRAEPLRGAAEAAVEIDLMRAGAGRRASAAGSSLGVGASMAAPSPTLRPRLRLTPTREDEAVHALFDAPTDSAPPPGPAKTAPPLGAADIPEAASTPAPREAGWSWKDLLSNVDDATPADEDETAGRMASEIAALGLDADALLPNARTLEASRALAAGGLDAVRDTVRRIAPAAVRRLSRRVLTDRLLRTDAARFLREQQTAIEAASRGGGDAVVGLFGSEIGRTYLLLEAAVGDVD